MYYIYKKSYWKEIQAKWHTNIKIYMTTLKGIKKIQMFINLHHSMKGREGYPFEQDTHANGFGTLPLMVSLLGN